MSLTKAGKYAFAGTAKHMSLQQDNLNDFPLRSINPSYQLCVRCVMDTSDPEIEFDSHGVCNHCTNYLKRVDNEVKRGPEGAEYLSQLVSRIQSDGKGKDYDCIAGVSGGVDSTSVLLSLKRLGLRPLAVHFDNGWNSELAVQNIRLALDSLQIPLVTHVVDWHEFRDIQLSFIKASVPNCEIPTDHAIHALLMRTAVSAGVRYIIGGGNVATEGIMPQAWTYFSPDLKHLKAIHRRFGTAVIRTYPTLSEATFLYSVLAKKIRVIPILNYLDYNKGAAIEELKSVIGWRPYGAKHFESVFTRFYQGYILPRKFGFDKRRPHFSCLIMAGEMDREAALETLGRDPYADHDLEGDLDYVVKKLRLSKEEFAAIMEMPARPHTSYPSNAWLFLGMKKYREKFRRLATQMPVGKP